MGTMNTNHCSETAYRWRERPRGKRADTGYAWNSFRRGHQDNESRYEFAHRSLESLCGRQRSRTESSEDLNSEFRKYADSWRNETGILSSIQAKIFNHNYQRIIGMGSSALPMIFEELNERGGYWYWALECITRDNPAQLSPSLAAAKTAWLDYARIHGYLR
jgi:hypothetical protein